MNYKSETNVIYTDKSIKYKTMELMYSDISNIKRDTKNFGFVFDYKGKNVRVPCGASDMDKLTEIYTKILRKEYPIKELIEEAQSLDDLLKDFAPESDSIKDISSSKQLTTENSTEDTTSNEEVQNNGFTDEEYDAIINEYNNLYEKTDDPDRQEEEVSSKPESAENQALDKSLKSEVKEESNQSEESKEETDKKTKKTESSFLLTAFLVLIFWPAGIIKIWIDKRSTVSKFVGTLFSLVWAAFTVYVILHNLEIAGVYLPFSLPF